MYILIKDGITHELNSIQQVIDKFNIQMINHGEIFCEGHIDSISYNMDEFTKEQAILDFGLTRLPHLLPLFKARLYKAERLH